ncbi:MAG: glycosyltransferase family 2 protein [Balneolia bacterium]|nr:glycosyltransferase family 2 protein [Balneolia bacterium]
MQSHKKKLPLVSIIIPTHNRVQLLKRALESCYAQTYQNIEIIVVNDGSSDDTEKWLMHNEDRIKAIHNETPQGAPYSRNKGAASASGAYLCFLDDDDELLPEKINKQVNVLEQKEYVEVGVLTCDMLKKGNDFEEVIENRKRGDLFTDLLAKYCVQGIHTMLVRTHIFKKAGGFDETLESNQEYDLMIHMAEITKFDFIPEVLAVVYATDGQISTNFRKKRNGTIRFIRKNRHLYLKAGRWFYIKQMARLWAIVAVYQLSMILGLRFYRLFVRS